MTLQTFYPKKTAEVWSECGYFSKICKFLKSFRMVHYHLFQTMHIIICLFQVVIISDPHTSAVCQCFMFSLMTHGHILKDYTKPANQIYAYFKNWKAINEE